jgi:protein TonB
VLLAALLHALLLFGVGFAMPEPRPASARNIEVMLVTQAAPMALPPDADSVKAQADRAGETLVPLPELDEPAGAAIDDDETRIGRRAARRNPCQQPMPPCHQSAKPNSARSAEPIRQPEPEPAPEPELEPEPAPEPQPPPADVLSAEQSRAPWRRRPWSPPRTSSPAATTRSHA